MVEEGEDIRIYDPNDWVIQVNDQDIEEPLSFEIQPQFSDELELIETLYGEVGFQIREASSKGTIRFSVADTSDSIPFLNDLAEQRSVVSIFNQNRQNPERYPITKSGLQFAILKPSARQHDQTIQGREYEAVGFGYQEV